MPAPLPYLPAAWTAASAVSEVAAFTSVSRCSSAGNKRIHNPAMTSVPTPPRTTEPTGPSHAAVAPDSNSPSWFYAPMKIELTALTRPRMASGVSSCTSDWRMTTLTMSAAPETSSATHESANTVDTPNTRVARP